MIKNESILFIVVGGSPADLDIMAQKHLKFFEQSPFFEFIKLAKYTTHINLPTCERSVPTHIVVGYKHIGEESTEIDTHV